MPITAYTSFELDLDLVVMAGTVTFEDYISAITQTIVHPRHSIGRPVLIDASELTDLATDLGEMRKIHWLLAEFHEGCERRLRMSTYAPTDYAYGISRMRAAYMQEFDFVDYQPWRTEREALGWLGMRDASIADLRARANFLMTSLEAESEDEFRLAPVKGSGFVPCPC